MSFNKIRQKKAYIEISEQIINSIIEGDFDVGDKLPSERQLTDEMDVSRNSVREALGVLQVLNIVETRPGAGTFVKTSPDTKELKALIFPILEESESPLVVFDARKAFEPGVVEQAIGHFDAKDLDMLEQILNNMVSCIKSNNYTDGYEANARFHLHIANTVENIIVRDTMTSLWKRTHNELLREMVISYWKESKDRAMEVHRGIFDAIVQENVTLVKELTRKHYDEPKKYFLRYLEKNKYQSSATD